MKVENISHRRELGLDSSQWNHLSNSFMEIVSVGDGFRKTNFESESHLLKDVKFSGLRGSVETVMNF